MADVPMLAEARARGVLSVLALGQLQGDDADPVEIIAGAIRGAEEGLRRLLEGEHQAALAQLEQQLEELEARRRSDVSALKAAVERLEGDATNARRALGEGWFTGGVDLATAIDRKCTALEADSRIDTLEAEVDRLGGLARSFTGEVAEYFDSGEYGEEAMAMIGIGLTIGREVEPDHSCTRCRGAGWWWEDTPDGDYDVMLRRCSHETIPAACRACGCTDDSACDGGCFWVEPNLCNRCVRTPVPGDLVGQADPTPARPDDWTCAICAQPSSAPTCKACLAKATTTTGESEIARFRRSDSSGKVVEVVARVPADEGKSHG